LSSDEAQQLLDRLAIEDTVTMVDRAMMRNTIESEITSLKEAEELFSSKLAAYEETDRDWNAMIRQQETAKADLIARKQEEIKAREALQLAQRAVVEAKATLVTTESELRKLEQNVRRNASDMDRVTTALAKKQDNVRNALKRKASLANGAIQVEYLTEEDLTALRRKEIQLMGENKQVARMVARLESRAEKLRNRAEALERWQNSGSLNNVNSNNNGINGAGLEGVQ